KMSHQPDFSVTVPDPATGGAHGTYRSSGGFSFLPSFLRLTFTPASLERVYQAYFLRQRQETLLALLVSAMLFNCYVIIMAAVLYSPDKLATLLAAIIGLAVSVAVYILLRLRKLPDKVVRKVVPYAAWLLITVQVLCYLGFNFAGVYEPGDAVGWQTFFTFSFLLTLPLPLSHVVLLAALSCWTHTVLLGIVVAQRRLENLEILIRQLVANMMLYFGAMVVGVMSYFMADRKYRTAFLEAKQSLEVSLTLDEQSTQQEELLLSILPKHIADEMLQGMKKEANQKSEAQQFNTMYMYRHENVSVYCSKYLPLAVFQRLQVSSRADGGTEDEHDLNTLLNKTLVDREMEETLEEKRTSVLSLRFVDPELETRYSLEKERQTGAAFSCSCVVLIFTSAMEMLIDPQLTVNYVTLAIGEVLLLILTICSLAVIFPRLFSEKLVSFSLWIDRTRWARNTWAMAAIFVLAMAEVADMLSCMQPPLLLLNSTAGFTLETLGDGGCAENPKHYSYIAVLSLVATTMLVQVSHLVKLALMLLVTVATSAVDIYSWRDIYDIYDLIRYLENSVVPTKYLMTVMIIVMMIGLYYFARHVRPSQLLLTLRTLFIYTIGCKTQIIHTLLGQWWLSDESTGSLTTRLWDRYLGFACHDCELYSQSYDEIGVMFASIPNFSDFYTEEGINNGGIECLRILNEIISDFDSLLDRTQFLCITKIKTIGSTYMAASGVTPESNTNGYSDRKEEDQCFLERWQHLADLADFALAMKVTLNNLNKQSFNSFMLRIGLNMGGVLAGVIGARKPHYDIWGNTVNVASRMESTGVMGNIQVVEDCYKILREYGFRFVRRGPIFVKGKGELLTYFMKGKDSPPVTNGKTVIPTLPNQIPDKLHILNRLYICQLENTALLHLYKGKSTTQKLKAWRSEESPCGFFFAMIKSMFCPVSLIISLFFLCTLYI
uniref:adenylate cyclase n=1 Tax=Astyanax mexicanus TaxID=7994 RepID=A0A8B9RDL4_ASTMX